MSTLPALKAVCTRADSNGVHVTAQHQPTKERRALVEAMTGYGIPEDNIARVLTIDAKTLRKYYREELDIGMIKATVAVAQTLYGIATDRKHAKCAPAAMFWLKCRAGWSEYAPPPPPKPPEAPRPEPLGKKEQADLEAQDAEIGTGWAEVVRPRTMQ